MENKKCVDCRYYNEDFNFCLHWRYEDITKSSGICNYFAPLTNGDKIRQMSNEQLASKFGYPCPPLPKKHCKGISNEECTECWLDWLNAPAESEGGGKDEP